MLRRMSEDSESRKPGIPTRDIRDPRALRALAHPVRLRLLEELAQAGQATATELAERIDESPANCSWHLRQLARYGFVEEAGGGAGRQRPWRPVIQSNRWGHHDDDLELAVAGDAAAEMLLDLEYERMRRWLATRRGEPADWRHAAFASQAVSWLTAGELKALDDEIGALFERYVDRFDPAARPPDARLIHFVAWGVPGRPADRPEEG
jgi:DNA-binding transcriptional ArsR family regulator